MRIINIKRVKDSYLRSRYFLLAILLAAASLLGNLQLTNSAHAAIGTITEYSVPSQYTSQPYLYPNELALGSDGQIWYTGLQRVGKLTTTGSFTQYSRGFATSSGIAAGADGNMWIGESNYIVKMTSSGTVLGTYNIPSGKAATKMVLGPDDAVWFITTGSIGKITTSGVITEDSFSTLTDITAGPDGNLWFTYAAVGSYSNGVGKITTSGTRTLYQTPLTNGVAALPQSITTGTDGNLWFTERGVNKIGKITTSGTITEYTLPVAESAPYGITSGSDGALWYTTKNTGKIGRITTSGVVTAEYGAGSSNSLKDIITGPDGAVWYIKSVNSIGRLATELSSQTISFTSTTPSDVTLDSPNYTPVATSTSGLPVTITVDSSSSGVCSIDSSGVVSFQGAGTCTLNANQPGDADYNPAPQVQQSFTVAPVNADTSVALDCPATVLTGTSVSCEITITNDGPAAAQNASLTALFSDSFSNISLSGGGVVSGQNVAWAVPSLSSGASVTLTFEATASAIGKARFNAALLQTSPDPDISNNIVESTITIH